MGYSEAVRDNVRFTGDYFTRIYYPLCRQCGKETKTTDYRSEFKYRCYECYELEKLKKKREKAEKKAQERADNPIVKSPEALAKIKEKHATMISKAIKRINRMADISRFIRPIEKVEADINAGAVFGSTEEVLVAIELTRQGVKYGNQVHFGAYHVDFVLDDYKIVLEVDGQMFHTDERKFKDELRDGLILAALGPQWDILRVSDESVNKHITHLTDAITDTMQARKRSIAYAHRNTMV